MFNLLPSIFKDEIKKEYKFRKWIVILLFTLLIEVSFVTFAFSILTISSNKEVEINNQIQKESETSISQNTSDILNTINLTNQKLTIFDKVADYPEILPLFNSIIYKKNKDISIREFSYVTGDAETNILIRGVSVTRESLVAFEKSLEETKLFSNVDLPVSNLAKQKDIEFSITIKVAK